MIYQPTTGGMRINKKINLSHMLVGLSGRGFVGNRDLANNGVCGEAAGKNHRVRIREDYIHNLYRRREDGGFQ